jgi:NAD(P)-dependent dehydrogenase (short-subunit alcohol dehydrogenase family)
MGEGRIVNISSFAGRGALPYGVPYAAAKWGAGGGDAEPPRRVRRVAGGFSVVFPGYVTGVGILARYQARGLKAPAVFGTTSPEVVGQAVVKAIRKDLPEVFATPYPVRPSLALAALAPRTAEKLAARMGLFAYPREATRLDGRLAPEPAEIVQPASGQRLGSTSGKGASSRPSQRE